MKTSRTTYILIGLFSAGLALLWGLEYAGVLTESQRMRRSERVLPELMDVGERAIRKIEIDRRGEKLVFERRGRYGWQMRSPIDVAAEAGALESLLQNLRAIRRSLDAGTIDGDPSSFGLAPPETTLRLWTGSEESTGPVAVLEIGKSAQNHRYVKTKESSGVDVVDRSLLAAIDRPVDSWRDAMLAPLPTFQTTGLTVDRPGLKIKVERAAGGQWRLTEPVRLPADGSKVEAALAALAGLRIQPASGGFAADGVKDFAPFGLDEPAATIELTSRSDPTNPTVLMVGKSPEGDPGRVYVRRADQDDVALVDSQFLAEIPVDRLGFRSRHVAEVAPPAVHRVEIKTAGGPFNLVRKPTGWELTSPRPARADRYLVDSLLGAIDALQTSEYLDPPQLSDVGLDPPLTTLRVWQVLPDAEEPRDDDPPIVELELGRRDVLRKTIYGRLPGDPFILTLPDSFADLLPRNSFAFRDRSLPSVEPAGVSRLTVVHEGRTSIVEAEGASTAPNQWRMTAPVKALADVRGVTAILTALSGLRADDFAADAAGDGVAFGLNEPTLEVRWEGGGRSGGLTVGKPVPGKPSSRFAVLSGFEPVVTLDDSVIRTFLVDLHDSQVLKYKLDDVRRLVLRRPDRTLAFTRTEQPTGQPTDWTPEPGTSIQGVDLSRFGDLVAHLSQLHAARFVQYEGPIPAAAGLASPRLVVEVGFGPSKPTSVLRLGAATVDGFIQAATGEGTTGPVFLLPSSAWEALIEMGRDDAPAAIPDDPFAPPDANGGDGAD